MRRSTKGTRIQGAFHRFYREVTRGLHPELSDRGHDFCEDFVRPPLDRSPQSLRAVLATLEGRGACAEAVEGARDAWQSHANRRPR